ARRCAVSLAAALALLRGRGGLSLLGSYSIVILNLNYHLLSICIDRTFQMPFHLYGPNQPF
ncbi:MAG: hypothetical protein ACI4W1_00090, partial [Ruminococcus sp.]